MFDYTIDDINETLKDVGVKKMILSIVIVISLFWKT